MTGKLCECHGEPMRWITDRRRPRGGTWRCETRRREHRRTYLNTEHGKRMRRDWNARTNPRRLFVGKDYYGQVWLDGKA